jgi:hypothetical protein
VAHARIIIIIILILIITIIIVCNDSLKGSDGLITVQTLIHTAGATDPPKSMRYVGVPLIVVHCRNLRA